MASVVFIGTSKKRNRKGDILPPLCSTTKTGQVIDKIEAILRKHGCPLVIHRINAINDVLTDDQNHSRPPRIPDFVEHWDYLKEEIVTLDPHVIVLLGLPVADWILRKDKGLRIHKFKHGMDYQKYSSVIWPKVSFLVVHHPLAITSFHYAREDDYVLRVARMINHQFAGKI